MTELVQADGDFDIWADLVEGLDKLPADYIPEPASDEWENKIKWVLIIYKTSPDSEVYYSTYDIASGAEEVREKLDYAECYLALETYPLSYEEFGRYLDGLEQVQELVGLPPSETDRYLEKLQLWRDKNYKKYGIDRYIT